MRGEYYLMEAALAVLTTTRPPVLSAIWRLCALMVLTSPMSSKLKTSTTWKVLSGCHYILSMKLKILK